MYKLMLVEDEAIVRESMIHNIDWERYGFTMACACENGREALERIGSVLPDVVVTDICMPFVDGLELARHLQEHYPSIFVVILTGFSEFSYAQQAIKLRVHDFILKPVVPREFCAILEKLSADLDSRNSQRSSLRSLQSRAYQAETILRSALFRTILRTQPTAEQVRRSAEEAGLQLRCAVYGAVFCQPQGRLEAATQSQHLQDAAQSVATRFPHCTAAVVEDVYPVLLVGGRTGEEVTSRCRDAAAMLSDAVSRLTGAPAAAGIGSCCTGPGSLHRTFREAHHALGYAFTQPQRLLVDHLCRAAERSVTEADPLPSTKPLRQALADGNSDEVERRMQALFEELRRRKLHRDGCLPLLERLRFILTDLIPADGVSAAPLLSPMDQWLTLEQAQQELSQLAAFLLRSARTSEDDDPARLCVERAMGLIQQNYHDSAFSLTELLSLLNVSKSYFSSAFKAQTGQTFTEYLTAVRMEKAKLLLTTSNLRTQEIADRIGFTDPHYFSVAFKRTVGKTPKEYREEGR